MSFTLFYDSGVVFLRSPELGDTHNLDTHVINRETIGGEVKSIKDSSWPNKQRRNFSFSNVSESVADDFETALIASAGEAVSIIDHNNEIWSGVIISNPTDIVTQRDTNCGLYELNFEMMCEFGGEPAGLENGDNDPVFNGDEEAIKVI